MIIEIAVPRSAVSKLRPRRTNGTVPVLKLADQDLRADVSVQVGRQKKTDVPGKGSQAGRVPSYSREGKAFCIIQGFSMRPTNTGEGSLLYSVYQFKC